MTFANLSPVPFNRVRARGSFWSARMETARADTIRGCLRRCEQTNRVANFRRAAGLEEGGFEGIYFNDSDVYKTLEGAAYALHNAPDPELERLADEIIDSICAAQMDDGYLFTYYVLTDISKRWTDMGMHEAYCLGHMIEGAIAYYQATGKDKWLKAAERAVAQMMDVFGPGKRRWVVGHQELELALMKLHRLTNIVEYKRFAAWLVEERGHGYLKAESFDRNNFRSDYCQDDLPASELSKVTGHAVRAMYYYSAIADIAAADGNQAYARALIRLWNNIVPANLYATGGIGQTASNEGFTRDWHLPNLTAYCETCAAIGMAMWNHRMNLLFGESVYADLVEQELYNGILSGISLDGLRFFYDNPLASVGQYKRSEWFGCSCCPTNLARFLPSVGGYAYAVGGGSLYVNQYIASDTDADVDSRAVHIEVDTEYPWNGDIKIKITSDDNLPIQLKLRIPGWCDRYAVAADGSYQDCAAQNGYVSLAAASGSTITLSLETPPRFLRADDRVKENAGRVAVAVGPVLYCAEECDQDASIPTEYFHAEFSVDPRQRAEIVPAPAGLSGMNALRLGGALLVPYYAWANRSQGGMAVWLKERTE
ncbi:MAG: glycoside hydrolase family 127 protein [Oscillospiraceae bacterium]|nr:glycoside hydrolase family 127 protein [Oscillospiraceae bacterium]